MYQSNAQKAENRRVPFRNRLNPDQTIEALSRAHGQLSLAGDLLGVSRQAVKNMVDRHPRVARALQESRERIVDVATITMLELLKAKDYRAAAFVLSSRIGRERGFNPPASEPVNGEPRQITEVIWRIIDTTTLKAPVDAATVIEHEAIADNRTEADL
jgi:hypothetical protein